MPGQDTASQDIASPCTKICQLDKVTGWCLGCGRTGAEIAAWQAMTPEARMALMRELPARLAAMGRDISAARS